MDSIYNIYYIEVNTICIIILLMMFFAVRGIKENVRMNVFRGMVVFDIIFCVTDVAAALLNGKLFVGARGILWTVNILYFVSAFIVALLWLTLSMYILEEKIQDSYYICTMVFGILVVLFFASAVFNGLCFTINEQNVYLRGPLL